MHLPALLSLHCRRSGIRRLDSDLCLQGWGRRLAAGQRFGIHFLDREHDCQDYLVVYARKSSRKVSNFAEIPSREYFCSASDSMDWSPWHSFLCWSHQLRLFPVGHVCSLLFDRTVIWLWAEHYKHC